MPTITFITNDNEISIAAVSGERLLDIARKANVAIDAPCSGNGSCGKCRVRIEANKSGLESDGSRHITYADYDLGWRLACETTVVGDAIVSVPDIASAYKSRLMTTDITSPHENAVFEKVKSTAEEAGFSVSNAFGCVTVTVSEPVLDDTSPDNERVGRAVAEALGMTYENGNNSTGDQAARPCVQFSSMAMRLLPDALRFGRYSVTVIYEKHADSAVNILWVGDADPNAAPYGLAIDLGTTTVSAMLVNLITGDVAAKASSGNGQIRFGADVINRIIEQQKPGGVRKLRSAIILETIEPIIGSLCAKSGVTRDQIVSVVIAGNTTMEHLVLGVSAQFLRMEPYVPAFYRLEPLSASSIAIQVNPDARVVMSPNIGSYVGGDITAGTLSSFIWNSAALTVFIDLGTNGEIVFGSNEFLMACACSAGPAFEGGDIKCGMRATSGAITAVNIDPITLDPTYEVIGSTPERLVKPVGICGSGLIDIIAELFSTGIIDGKGNIIADGERIKRDEFTARYVLAFPHETNTGREVYVDETDIDNFIRTKGAIFAAVKSMMASVGFSPADCSRILIAGGIGSGINIENAVKIGMLPKLPSEIYAYIGNSSLMGAYLTLTRSAAAVKLDELSRSMTYMELSTYPGYMDEFVAACFLPHTDLSLFE